MKKLKQTKGITLVALVISIIILLILAGISIQALTNTGLFAQVEEAKKRTENAQKEEDEILKNYLEQMNAIIGGQVAETIPDGAVVTPINDITTWLKTAGISKQYSYTTIEQVIADSTCTESLMNNENAMKYLVRSTGFADAICASETAMTYLGDSAYIDDNVLNSDIWVTSISSSNYYELIYDPIIVHSSASATISFNEKSFTSDTSGNTTKIIPWGTYTFSDSVSGQSFERTIDKNTTDLYVMPEGALYWYGFESYGISLTITRGTPTIVKKTNCIYSSLSGNCESFLITSSKIDLTEYNTIHWKINHISGNVPMFISLSKNYIRYIEADGTGHDHNPPEHYIINRNMQNMTSDIHQSAGSYNVFIMSNANANPNTIDETYAIWFE